MNLKPDSRAEGTMPAVVRDQIDQQEARLWDRARLNLMLLYGGLRVEVASVPGGGRGGVNRPFAHVDLKV